MPEPGDSRVSVLVTGPESSGTRLTASLLRAAGANVVHSSPHYRVRMGEELHDGAAFDAVVVVVRMGHANARSMVDNEHAADLAVARSMVPGGIHMILEALASFDTCHIVTYEALVHEPGALRALCRDLDLAEEFEHEPVGAGNSKYFGGEFFRDVRDLEERSP